MIKEPILYIHGFNSHPKGKMEKLKKKFPDNEIIGIELKYGPDDILNLYKIVQEHKSLHIVGTSLGAFYTLYLLNKFNVDGYDLKGYVINPSITPSKTLYQYIDKELTNYQTGKKHRITNDYIEFLKLLENEFGDLITPIIYCTNFYFSLNDEVINHTSTLSKIRNSNQPYNIYISNQDHRHQNIKMVVDGIKEKMNIE